MVFDRVLIVLFLFFSYFTFAQEDEVMPTASRMPKKEIKREVSFRKVEQAPIFPGCEKLKTEQAKRKCFQKGIGAHLGKHFNRDLANSLDLALGRYRIMVKFKIDLKGNITNITAGTPHPKLEEEAIRVINKLPKMVPGKERKRPVIVKYALPIQFEVEDDKPIKK